MRLLDRRTLVADVGRGLFEAGFGGAGPEDGAENVEADLFADVELDQDEDGAAEGGGGLGSQIGGLAAESSGAVMVVVSVFQCLVGSGRWPVASSFPSQKTAEDDASPDLVDARLLFQKWGWRARVAKLLIRLAFISLLGARFL